MGKSVDRMGKSVEKMGKYVENGGIQGLCWLSPKKTTTNKQKNNQTRKHKTKKKQNKPKPFPRVCFSYMAVGEHFRRIKEIS